jgi:hypothetical protein
LDTINSEIKQLKDEIEKLKIENLKLNDRITNIEKAVNKCAPESRVSKIETDIKREKKESREKEDKKAKNDLFRLKSVL